jgi:hypothetical protein
MRQLTDVIEILLRVIPQGEAQASLRASLESAHSSAMFSPPENMRPFWERANEALAEYLRPKSEWEDWELKVFNIFGDRPHDSPPPEPYKLRRIDYSECMTPEAVFKSVDPTNICCPCEDCHRTDGIEIVKADSTDHFTVYQCQHCGQKWRVGYQLLLVMELIRNVSQDLSGS